MWVGLLSKVTLNDLTVSVALTVQHRSFADRDVQAAAFRSQILLALRYNLPLVLHIRDQGRTFDGSLAEQDCYRILKECNVPRDFPIHRHCFNGDESLLLKCLMIAFSRQLGVCREMALCLPCQQDRTHSSGHVSQVTDNYQSNSNEISAFTIQL